MVFGLRSTQQQLADFRDAADSGVALVHIDTCLGSFLQDHHNRDGECLFGISVDGDTSCEDVRDQLRRDMLNDERIPEYVTKESIDAALLATFGTEDLGRQFNATLESAPKEEDFESDDLFEDAQNAWEAAQDGGESVQAWFVLTWTHKPFVAYDIRDADGYLVHNVIVTDEERKAHLSDYDDGKHVWTETGRYSEEEADGMSYNYRGLVVVGDAAGAIKKALAILEQVDFSIFPGLYDAIPWKRLEGIAK